MIKNLIIPIDISPLSERSIEYALVIGKMLPTLKITLVGCCVVEEKINETIKNHLDKYGSSFVDKDNINFVTAKGKFHEEIGSLANSVEDPLILMSAYKDIKNRDYFSMQDVIKVVDTAKQHVIILPENDYKLQIKKITYPIHMQTRVRHKATFTAKMSKLFDAEVDIVSTQINLKEKKKKMCTLYCQQVSNHYKSVGIPITINSVEGSNLASVISDYSKETGSDLISVIPEDNKDIRLFSVSYIEDLLLKIEVPTLIIAGRKVKYSGSFSASGG